MTSASKPKLIATATTEGSLPLFIDLSSVLTGFSHEELWGTGMVQTFYDSVNLIIGEREMGKLLGVSSSVLKGKKNITTNITSKVEAEIEKKILNSDRYGPVSFNIIRLWYLGAWKQLPREWRNNFGATSYDVDHIISSQAYQESLVWTAGETHPMGAKQQGFGAWASPGPGADGAEK